METKKKNKTHGILGTIIVHAILISLLAFFGFSVPLPLPAEQGMLINFGYDESGDGMIESGQSSSNSKTEVQKTTPNDNTNGTENQTITQDFEDAVSIKNKSSESKNTTNTKEVKTQQVQEVIEERKVDENALFPGKGSGNGTSGNGAGESDGNSGGTGNQGSQDGSPDSKNYSGNSGGNGNGISFSLGGRVPNGLPKPEYNVQEEGKVVVEIIVDRNGSVVRATPGAKGTTTTNKTLWNSAKKAAMETHFNKKADALEEQKGTITYHFILQ